jgi:anion-transporting  ArsA/GET3 family ATPase
MNIGGPIALDTNDIAVISKTMNRKLGPYNKRLNNIGEKIFTLTETKPEGYLKEIKKLNKQGKSLVKEATSKLPKEYKKYTNNLEKIGKTSYTKGLDLLGFKYEKRTQPFKEQVVQLTLFLLKRLHNFKHKLTKNYYQLMVQYNTNFRTMQIRKRRPIKQSKRFYELSNHGCDERV